MKKWGLSLRGGGTNCVAYLGVLLALEEEGIKPDVIIGSSAGALIGMIYGTGKYEVNDLIRFLSEIKQTELLNRNPLTSRTLWTPENYKKVFGRLIGEEARIEDNKIPTFVQFTDPLTKTPVILSEGRILDLIPGAMSFPWLLQPYEGRLIDGDLTAGFDAKFLKERDAEVVLGLSLGAGPNSGMMGFIEGLIARNFAKIEEDILPDILFDNFENIESPISFANLEERAYSSYESFKGRVGEIVELLNE